MAVLSMFYGLVVSMFYGDNKQHKLPHIHVKYQDFEGVFSIPDGELIAGNLPPKKNQVSSSMDCHARRRFDGKLGIGYQ